MAEVSNGRLEIRQSPSSPGTPGGPDREPLVCKTVTAGIEEVNDAGAVTQ